MGETKQKIGFIGLGLMGQGFTKRLTECGYRVTGFDLDATKVEQASKHGVIAASNAAEVAKSSDVVLVCVTSTDGVEKVIFGAGGVAETASPGMVLVDHSTSIVANTKDMAVKLKAETGMGWVDAPVSGGPEGAEAGELAIMAGGGDVDVAIVQSIMDDVSSAFTVFGPVGSGQVAKMVNQVLVLNNYAVLAEALALAEAGGIDASKIPDALATGHAGSNMLKNVFPRMIKRDYAPKGYARQLLKDLDMLHDLAKSLKTPTPISSQTASLLRILNSKGHEELDGIAIMKLYDQSDTV
ncbi:MAG: NAD(P)-dependent oxidoreductase [Rhodospirillales bacterium]|jgi:3-hydroxyisobutyrate dehydrogenase|tara:strand:- start:502 stop:1392 length:891 start_codon:yes stop_codon:yes gene_type:complete